VGLHPVPQGGQSAEGLKGRTRPQAFLFGPDRFGRDIFSRALSSGWIDLSIGPLSLVSACLGILISGISGYYSGKIDILVQRTIGVFQSFPAADLAGAGDPRPDPSPAGEGVHAGSQGDRGLGHGIILRHLLPNITSYPVVAALVIPGMTLSEATISFLGCGIKEPMAS